LVSGELGIALRVTSTSNFYAVILDTATNTTVLIATVNGVRTTLATSAWPNGTVWTNMPITVDAVYGNTGLVITVPAMNATIKSSDVRVISGAL
jgi:hypothetical protein